MEELIISCKETEYLSRYYLADYTGKREKARKLALMTLVMLRKQSRAAHERVESLRSEIREMRRSMKKISAASLKFPLGEMRVKELEHDVEDAKKELVRVGKEMHQMLGFWQRAGAFFEDLCNLCNRDPAQVQKELLKSESKDDAFADLVMVHNLDYKNPRDTGWLEDSVDAPLTHALKAYMLDAMLHTEAGRKAAHEAMNAVFPEVMDHAGYLLTDEDGVQHFCDKNGYEIGVVEPEE